MIVSRLVAIGVIVCLIVGACGPGANDAATLSTPVAASARTPTATRDIVPSMAASPSPGPVSLATLLDRLVVAPEHRDGYDRELFPHWSDADLDGCNTRYEVLLEQAVTPPAVSGSCHLTGGAWLSPYDGVTLHDATNVQTPRSSNEGSPLPNRTGGVPSPSTVSWAVGHRVTRSTSVLIRPIRLARPWIAQPWG